MYTSTQDFTLTCAVGSGAAVTKTATATSIISQRDAYLKAYELARALAVEYIVCSLDPDVPPTIYLNAEVTASASASAPYFVESFSVTIPAGGIYSLVSQVEADAAAATAAAVQANQKMEFERRLIYYNSPKSDFGACDLDYVPYSVTATVASNTFSSLTNQAIPDSKAVSAARSSLLQLLGANCIRLYRSVPVSYNAVCGGGTVGDSVLVTYAEGRVTTTASQSAADSEALSTATSAASGALVCVAGFYNVEKTGYATCLAQYGSGWTGDTASAVVSAGAVFDTTQSAADSLAQSTADNNAIDNLICEFTGGILP